MNSDKLKRILRRLKKDEVALRFGRGAFELQQLVWTRFFSTGANNPYGAMYPISRLLQKEEALDDIIAEYFYEVYTQYCRENGNVFNADADEHFFPPKTRTDGAALKKRFRLLAKQAHPDHGGSHEQFIRLMNEYHKLLRQDERSD